MLPIREIFGVQGYRSTSTCGFKNEGVPKGQLIFRLQINRVQHELLIIAHDIQGTEIFKDGASLPRINRNRNFLGQTIVL